MNLEDWWQDLILEGLACLLSWGFHTQQQEEEQLKDTEARAAWVSRAPAQGRTRHKAGLREPSVDFKMCSVLFTSLVLTRVTKPVSP